MKSPSGCHFWNYPASPPRPFMRRPAGRAPSSATSSSASPGGRSSRLGWRCVCVYMLPCDAHLLYMNEHIYTHTYIYIYICVCVYTCIIMQGLNGADVLVYVRLRVAKEYVNMHFKWQLEPEAPQKQHAIRTASTWRHRSPRPW